MQVNKCKKWLIAAQADTASTILVSGICAQRQLFKGNNTTHHHPAPLPMPTFGRNVLFQNHPYKITYVPPPRTCLIYQMHMYCMKLIQTYSNLSLFSIHSFIYYYFITLLHYFIPFLFH